MRWYIVEDGVQKGPFTEEEFWNLARSGRISPKTWVWRSGQKDWRRWSDLQEELRVTQALQTSGIVGAEPGRASLFYGGFWIRFVAKLLDWLTLSVLQIVVGIAVLVLMPGLASSAFDFEAPSGIRSLLGFIITIGYSTLFVGMYGATPGKMALGLEVVRPDGSPVGYGKALCRALAEILSSVIFCIGYLMAAFDGQKRTLHDRICETRVVKKMG